MLRWSQECKGSGGSRWGRGGALRPGCSPATFWASAAGLRGKDCWDLRIPVLGGDARALAPSSCSVIRWPSMSPTFLKSDLGWLAEGTPERAVDQMPSSKGGLSIASQCLPHWKGPPCPVRWEVQASAPPRPRAQGRPGGAELSLKGRAATSQSPGVHVCACVHAWKVCTGMCQWPVQGHVLGHECAHTCVQGMEVHARVYEHVPEGPVWMCAHAHTHVHTCTHTCSILCPSGMQAGAAGSGHV